MPELGVVRAEVPPIVVLTSNRTRDVHDALKRRCLYHWIAHPDFERELAIVRLRAPEVPELLAREVAAAVEALRGLELYKPPGVAETIDWAQALATLGAHAPRRARRSTRRSARSSSTARIRSACARTGSTSSSARRWRAVPDDVQRASTEPDAGADRGRVRARAARRRARRAGRRDARRSRRRSAASGSTTASGVYWAGRATLVRPARGHRRRTTARSRRSGIGDGRRARESSARTGRGDRARVRRRAAGARAPGRRGRRRRARRSRCAGARPRCCGTATSRRTRRPSSPRRAG